MTPLFVRACRRKATAQGKRTRQLPSEVTEKVGEANLLYASGKCVPDTCSVCSNLQHSAPPLSSLRLQPHGSYKCKSHALCVRQTLAQGLVGHAAWIAGIRRPSNC